MGKLVTLLIGGVCVVFLIYFTFLIYVLSVAIKSDQRTTTHYQAETYPPDGKTFHGATPIEDWLHNKEGCPEIDIVYTWVNGSDPAHIKKRKDYLGVSSDGGRYRDIEQLRYSLRSVEKHAPYARHVWIVTDHQIPRWLNTSNERVSVINHKTIFQKDPHKYLPTFNSNSIELNIHNIPGLAECFVYLNDDMFFGRPSKPDEDFWDPKTNEQLLYWSSWTIAPPEEKLRNIWKMAVRHSNSLLDRVYGKPKEPRHFFIHGVYFWKKTYLRELAKLFEKDYEISFSHRTRKPTDVTLPFLYGNYVKHAHPHRVEKSKLKYSKLVNDFDQVTKSLNRLKKQRPHWVCLNDGLGQKPDDRVVQLLIDWLEDYFPEPSQFELKKRP